MANAPGTYGARSADAGDGWGPSTSVRSKGAELGTDPDSLDDSRPARIRGAYARTSRPETDAPGNVLPLIPSRGVSALAADGVMVGAVVLGGLIDWGLGSNTSVAVNILLIIGSVAAIFLVRHGSMFAVMVAPPIVYSVASGFILFVRSSGLHNHKQLIDAASNWLVYGFPTVAAATAAVLIIGGGRKLARR